MKSQRIVITGGHLTPALSIIQKLKAQKKWEIYYFGRKYSFEGKKILSEEYKIVPKSEAKFVSLTTGRLQRKFTRYTLPSLVKIPWGIIQSLYFLFRLKPKIILSFGSYVSVPVVIAGWLLRIPIISHEQTISPGLANKINARFSKIVSVSYSESVNEFPSKKVVLTGNPILPDIIKFSSTPLTREIALQIKKTGLPLIYVTGGNQGSAIINETVREILSRLLNKFIIIHQTGNLDFQVSLTFFEQLPEKLKERYFLSSYIGKEDIGWVFKFADLVISRSGANVCWDLGTLGKPAILIPIPFSSGNEQYKNARRLADLGLVEIIEQKELTPNKLFLLIEEVFTNLDQYRKVGRETRKEYPRNGALKLIKIIDEILAKEK